MAEDFDQKLAAELAEDFEGLKEQLRLAMTTTVRVAIQETCPGGKDGKGCSCKHVRYAEVPDYKTKLALVEWWANRSHGRPGQAEGEAEERVTVNRYVVLPEEDGGVV